MAKPTETAWKADDAQGLRTYLLANPKFLGELRKAMPRSGLQPSTEQAANAGQAVEGYMMAIDNIEALMDPDSGGLTPAAKFFSPKPEDARQL